MRCHWMRPPTCPLGSSGSFQAVNRVQLPESSDGGVAAAVLARFWGSPVHPLFLMVAIEEGRADEGHLDGRIDVARLAKPSCVYESRELAARLSVDGSLIWRGNLHDDTGRLHRRVVFVFGEFDVPIEVRLVLLDPAHPTGHRIDVLFPPDALRALVGLSDRPRGPTTKDVRDVDRDRSLRRERRVDLFAPTVVRVAASRLPQGSNG